jgi:hypothetical protein
VSIFPKEYVIMQTARKITFDKIARKNDLYRIVATIFELPGTSNLSRRARRYLFFFIALAREGYCQIVAPLAVLADAIYRAQGQTASIRTLSSALAELERAGFILRHKCRLGAHHSSSVIDLYPERFAFWTRVRTQKISPLPISPQPTSSYISPCRQVLPTDDRTIDHSRVNSCCSSVINNKEQRARARSNKSANFAYHPIIYTLICVIDKNDARKAELLDTAKREIAGGENLTGIDWSYYSRLWHSLDSNPGGRRERTARAEIIPLLTGSFQMTTPAEQEISPAPFQPEPNPQPDYEPVTPEMIAEFRKGLSLPSSSLSPQGFTPSATHETAPRARNDEIGRLSPEDYLFLNRQRILTAHKKSVDDGGEGIFDKNISLVDISPKRRD